MVTKILDSIILTPEGLSSETLTTEDRFYLLMEMRILAFGKDYSFKSRCGSCGAVDTVQVDLAQMKVGELPDDFSEPIEADLPVLGKKVGLRLLRGTDIAEVSAEVRRRAKMTGEESGGMMGPVLRVSRHLMSVGGKEMSRTDQEKFILDLPSRDLLTIQQTIDRLKYGVDLSIVAPCGNCGEDMGTRLQWTEEFFRPAL
jgi:hypothetical protein